jgi:hypothetical protein
MKDMILLVDKELILDNPGVIKTCSFPLVNLIFKEILLFFKKKSDLIDCKTMGWE